MNFRKQILHEHRSQYAICILNFFCLKVQSVQANERARVHKICCYFFFFIRWSLFAQPCTEMSGESQRLKANEYRVDQAIRIMYTPISMHSTLFLTDFFFSSFLLFGSSLNLAQKQNSLELMLSKRYSCEGRKKNSNSFAKKNQHDSRANITEEQRKKKVAVCVYAAQQPYFHCSFTKVFTQF